MNRISTSGLWMGWLLIAVATAVMYAARPNPAAAGGIDKPLVFLEGEGFDRKAMEAAVPFARFVAGRNEANVVILVSQRAADAGGGFSVSFAGQKEWQGIDDLQTWEPPAGSGEKEAVDGLVRAVKLGLVNYAAKTSSAARLDVTLAAAVKPTAVADPWHFWVFNISSNNYFNGEKSYRSSSIGLSLSASKMTPEVKVRLGLSADFSWDRYDYEGEVIRSEQEYFDASAICAKSLGEHWSAGGWFEAEASTYRNIRRGFSLMPACEYNFYPYSESTKRQLRLLYRVGLEALRYREETIYDRVQETLFKQALSATLEMKSKWGSLRLTLEGSNYFHDLRKNQVSAFTYVDIKLFKGLSFYVISSGARIHDQLYLPKAGATYEEVLLRRQQLQTGYEYFAAVGLSYNFGSIHSRIVNPRFGASSSGGVTIHVD